MSIQSKYEVWDDTGRPLFYIERPTYPMRTLLGYGTAVLAAGLAMSAVTAVVPEGFEPVALPLAVLSYGIMVTVFMVVSMSLRPLRHVTIFRDETRRERLLEIRQDQRVAFLRRTYTVRLPDGTPLARLQKQYLHNLVRKRWYAYSPDGRLLAMAIEDSMILSLLRRVLGSLFGLLRTNFLLVRGTDEEVFGEFNRKYTVLDRYLLDLTADPARVFDRRVAVSLGVMLDSGERR
jgi:hypothetical protein